MNLSGIFNLPEPNRSESASQTQAPQNSGNALTPSAAEPNGGKTDQTTLSASGLAAAQSSAPDSDVRMDKVASVSAAIQSGTYNVSSTDVADNIMQGMFDSNLR